MQLGNKIQEQRKKINMTQEKLAAEMGVSVTAISKWENENSMPDMDGIEILKTIKEQYEGVRVIMVTADDTEKVRQRAIENGADAYITKPFLPEHIECVLKELFFI